MKNDDITDAIVNITIEVSNQNYNTVCMEITPWLVNSIKLKIMRI